MRGMRSVKYRNVDTGTVEVREVYTLSSCKLKLQARLLQSGKCTQKRKVHVVRNGKQLADTKRLRILNDLKMMLKKYLLLMNAVFPFENWDDIKPGDVLECYIVEKYRD